MKRLKLTNQCILVELGRCDGYWLSDSMLARYLRLTPLAVRRACQDLERRGYLSIHTVRRGKELISFSCGLTVKGDQWLQQVTE